MLQIIGFLFWFTLFLFGIMFLALIIRAMYWTIEEIIKCGMDQYDLQGLIFFIIVGIIDIAIIITAFNNVFIK